jgi:hypothetical protein
MSLAGDKKNIFTTIGTFTSVAQSGQIPDTTNVFPSVNNKKEVVPFLLDILKVVVGTDALQMLTGELFTSLIDNVEPKLKDAVKKQANQYNAGDNLPSIFTSGGTGIRVKIKDIDIKGDLKINPSSAIGDLKYPSAPLNFNKTAYDAIQNAGTEIPYGMSLMMKYDEITDEMIFRENPTLGTTVGTWANAFINDMAIIDKKQFLTNVMDKIYGTVSKVQGKSVTEAYNGLYADKLIEQLVNDNQTFLITPEDNAALLQRAEEVINGIVYYDLGCGVMGASLPLSGLTSLINSISGSTDPTFIGNQINNTIADSVNDPAVNDENKQSIKDGFFQRLINLITNEFANALTTTPQIRALLAITSAFQNGGVPKIGSIKDDLKKFKTIINCNINAIMTIVGEFIFNMVVRFLIALLNPVIRKIIVEKITQYSGIIKSLTGTST